MIERRTSIVLAVMDGYRVTGPDRQLLAAAAPRPCSRIATSLDIFQRSVGREQLGAVGRRMLEGHLAWDCVARSLLEAYEAARAGGREKEPRTCVRWPEETFQMLLSRRGRLT